MTMPCKAKFLVETTCSTLSHATNVFTFVYHDSMAAPILSRACRFSTQAMTKSWDPLASPTLAKNSSKHRNPSLRTAATRPCTSPGLPCPQIAQHWYESWGRGSFVFIALYCDEGKQGSTKMVTRRIVKELSSFRSSISRLDSYFPVPAATCPNSSQPLFS